MCIVKNKKKLKINPHGGCATPPNVPKLGVSGVKDTAKTKFRKFRHVMLHTGRI